MHVVLHMHEFDAATRNPDTPYTSHVRTFLAGLASQAFGMNLLDTPLSTFHDADINHTVADVSRSKRYLDYHPLQ